MSLSELHLAAVDSRSAVDHVVVGAFNGVNLVCFFRHVNFPEDWVELRLWTSRSQFQAHESLITNIASTLRLRN